MSKLYKTIIFISLFISYAAHSDDMLKQIQERAAKVKQYRELLGNPDQTIRISALDVMLKSDDHVMRELAFNLGFSSADDAMRAIALKNKIVYMKQLNFNLSLTETPTEVEKKGILEEFSYAYSIDIQDYDINSGAFKFRNYGRSKGQVSGTGLSLQDNSYNCSANTALSEGATLMGTLKCTAGKYKGSYLMEIQLQ